jgi:tetratricopeptide (TPR) repeat protein
LCDHLAAIIGADRVFMDVEDIVPGQDFVETIDCSIAACETALIVIGPHWNEILRERSQKKEPDYVCHEVSSALDHKLRIVPVLVGGATMPRQEDLPAALSGLPFHEAAELRDSTFKDDCERLAKNLQLAPSPKSTRRKWLLAAIVVAAVTALFGLWMFWTPGTPPADPRLATARTQTELGEHQSAFRSYGEVLKTGPANPAVMDLQATAAMAWLRDFSVTVGEGQKAEDIAGPPLAEIIGVLEAALARTGGRGPRAGDILAHLGWAHWLNQHLAFKEFGPAAERDLRQSLTVDPTNVFAHAMLGNWLLQTHGDTAEALRHFAAAEETKQQRPLLRQMQLGGMISNQDPGMPAAVMRVVNQMRINGETIAGRYRSRVLTYFRPGNRDELQEMLSAVPPGDAWATFLWLDDPPPGDDLKYEGFHREFIHARVLELDGKTAEALALFTELDRKMRSARFTGRLLDDVSDASKRLRSTARLPTP